MARRKSVEAVEADDDTEVGEAGFYTLTIQGKRFNVRAPFAEGHVLTENQAHALNQVRAENIRNNGAQLLKKLAEKRAESGEVVSEEEAEKLIEDYDSSYEFGVRGARGPRIVLDPVTEAERRLALEAVKMKIKAQHPNLKLKEIPKEHLDSLVNQVVEKGYFRAEAEEIVAKRSARPQIEISLGDLTQDAA